jgi:hypothetical protein
MRLLAVASRRRRLIRNAAWGGALVAFSLVAAGVASGADPPSSRCVPDVLPLPEQSMVAPKGAVLSSEAEGFRLRFDDARGVASDVVVLSNLRPDVSLAPGDRIQAEISGYLTSGDRPIYPSAMNPHVEVVRITPAGNVEICFELDADHVSGAHPGEYAGTVFVSGEDLAVQTAIPVAVTFRSSRSLALSLAFAGVLLGLLVKMFTELAAARRGPPGPPRSLRQYVAQWTFPAALILGAIAGWLGYVQNYDGSAVWGSKSADTFKLFATCFAFQLGTVGGMDLARRLAGEAPPAPTPAAAGS